MLTAPPFRISAIKRSHHWLKSLFYGPQGIGKTTLAASAADVLEMADVFIINAESGHLALIDNARVKNIGGIMQAPASTFRQVGLMYDYLLAHCKHRDENNIQRLRETEAYLTGVPIEEITVPKKFRTVIIDTMTEVEAYNMYALMEVDENKLMQGSAEDVEVADWGVYRRNKMMVELLVRRFRDLPMHVILICHEAYTEDEMKRKLYTPLLTGKLINSVQGMVDLVGFLRKSPPGPDGKEVRRLLVQPERQFTAKCRIAGFKGQYFDDPTMANIMKAIGLLGTK